MTRLSHKNNNVATRHINVRRSHSQPQFTSQLVREDRFLFVWFDPQVSVCRQQQRETPGVYSIFLL